MKARSNKSLLKLASSAPTPISTCCRPSNEKREILGILDQCIRSDRVQIFIGRESGLDWFENCSVVTAPYSVDGEVVGVLGVIGPTRMSYDRVIPIVDVTARLLGSALGDHPSPESQ